MILCVLTAFVFAFVGGIFKGFVNWPVSMAEDLGATESVVRIHLDFQGNMVAFLLGEIMLLCISLNC